MKISNTATRLKEVMAEKNLKQVDLLRMTEPYCEKYGVKMNKSDISQYCSGKVEPNQNKLFVLGATLNVNEAWLMGYDVPKQRGVLMTSNHQEIGNDILFAIQTLAECSNYKFEIFNRQYQISTSDYIVKLSPNEVNDYAQEAIRQVQFITNNIIRNKLRENIVPISQDYILPQAAHERTDVDVTPEMKQHDDDMMDDDNLWK